MRFGLILVFEFGLIGLADFGVCLSFFFFLVAVVDIGGRWLICGGGRWLWTVAVHPWCGLLLLLLLLFFFWEVNNILF